MSSQRSSKLEEGVMSQIVASGIIFRFSAFFPIFPDLLQALEHGTGPGTAYSHMIILGHGT